uniref:Transcriptional regulator, SARP family n=1 Tax=Nonomuraea gerenzanensis TaxID=93944 RepID=A0A1M4EEL4_9ACTN|nr:transcriptional regulator, SARP family [Nonomuraea gerenzanensis]
MIPDDLATSDTAGSLRCRGGWVLRSAAVTEASSSGLDGVLDGVLDVRLDVPLAFVLVRALAGTLEGTLDRALEGALEGCGETAGPAPRPEISGFVMNSNPWSSSPSGRTTNEGASPADQDRGGPATSRGQRHSCYFWGGGMSESQGDDVRFEVLGPLRAWRARTSLALGSGRRRTLLAVLLLHANRPVSRDRLIDELWGRRVPAYAVNLLQKHMSSLRAGLEPGRRGRRPSGALTWTEAGYVLRVPSGGLDLEVFEREVRRAREAHAAGDLRGASHAFHAALRLWRGPVCDGLGSPFLDMMRDQLAERRIGAIEECMEVDMALGDQADLVAELRWLVANHPLRERLHGLLMLALYRSGRQAEALAAFRDARRRLMEELGVEPTALLQNLHQRILAADPGLMPPSSAADASPSLSGLPAAGSPARPGPAPDDSPEQGPPPHGTAAHGTAAHGTGTARRRTGGGRARGHLTAGPPPRSSRAGYRSSSAGRRSWSGSTHCWPTTATPAAPWCSPAWRAWARPPWRSTGPTRSNPTSPTASCTSTCADSTRQEHRWSPRTRSRPSWTRSRSNRTSSPQGCTRGPHSSAASSRAAGC